jgi:anti-sigma regulatory factor (Ser/Thr protein kinase)
VPYPADAPGRASSREIEITPEALALVRGIFCDVARRRFPDRRHDTVLAVHELAVNALVHGGSPRTLRVVELGSSVVFEVRDRWIRGRPKVQPLRRHRISGRGLWLAEQLGDDLVVETGDFTTVRLCVRDEPAG